MLVNMGLHSLKAWHVQIEGARRGDVAEMLKAAGAADDTGVAYECRAFQQ